MRSANDTNTTTQSTVPEDTAAAPMMQISRFDPEGLHSDLTALAYMLDTMGAGAEGREMDEAEFTCLGNIILGLIKLHRLDDEVAKLRAEP